VGAHFHNQIDANQVQDEPHAFPARRKSQAQGASQRKAARARRVHSTARTHTLPPAQKKRLRNRHASTVSRIRKKLMYYTLQRELDAIREVKNQLEIEVRGQRGSIAYFQKENARLRKELERYTQESALEIDKE
jgi:hypothetical protein